MIRDHLGKLAAHIVVALVILVVIGGATRVMEAGLACPDWPLCYGSLLPINRMNLQVFLEWFHRLDAFFVGITLSLQLLFSWIYRSSLPKWFPWFSALIFLMLLLQGGLGALTVIDLLPSYVVVGHLFLALTLLALMSGVTQLLISPSEMESPFWWKMLAGVSLSGILAQCLIGSRMATTWSVQKCIANGSHCYLLDFHKLSVIPSALGVFILLITSIYLGGWFRAQWRFLLFVCSLLMMQIIIGFISLNLGLSEPLLRVLHQLVASLLVASLAALICRRPIDLPSSQSEQLEDSSLEVCHG